MKKFYLYYQFGACNEGDHSCGLECFDTVEEAMARLAEIREREYDAEIVVLEGRRL